MSDDNRKHRPPHMAYKIRELIKLKKYDEAQKCTDENVAFYDAKIGEQQDLFLEAQVAKMGLEMNPDTKLAAASNTPKRRVPTSRIFGEEGIRNG
jgi:hypothetical protein